MAGEKPIVRFEDVCLKYGDTVALDHVSFQLFPGESRIIFGAAGTGKTVLVKAAAGLVKPDSGRIYIFDEEITQRKEQELFEIRARVGILFQEGGLFDSLNIADNVAYPLRNHPTLQKKLGQNGSARTIEERAKEALTFVELGHTLEKFPSEVSGGMRRRVGIARAMVTEPALMLYDSPTSGLDPITANNIISVILKERELRNTATLMVTHRYQDGHLMANFRYNPDSGKVEPDQAKRGRTLFFVMNQGRLVFEGSEAELQASTDSYVRKFRGISVS